MKKSLFFISVITLYFFSTNSSECQKVNFTGNWKLDRGKSVIQDNFPALTRINIKIAGDSLLTERIYETSDGQEHPFSENVTLDGKEVSMIIYDMPRKSKAIWSEPNQSLIFESTTTFNGANGTEDIKTKETWIIDKTNNSLTIAFKNNTSAGESGGSLYFNKADQNK
jgi:predicted outer membrane repeat protein